MWFMNKPLAVRYETESGALITVQGTLMGVSSERGAWMVHLAILGRSDRMRIIPHDLIRAVMQGNRAEERVSLTPMRPLEGESAVPLVRSGC
jgi:hypothetical protein